MSQLPKSENYSESIVEKVERLEKQLSNREQILELILESTIAGYWDWHIPENYEYLSPRFKSMFGYEDHEMENSPHAWQKIIHPEDLPKVFEKFNQHVASKGKILYENEVRYYHKNGSIIWVYCRGKVIAWDEEDNPVRMVGSHIDITPLKQAEQKERYARLFMEKRNKELGHLAYIASHDLKEPLNTIGSFIQLLEEEVKGKVSEDVDIYLNFIAGAANRMGALINSLLDYSRLGVNKIVKAVDLNLLIDNIILDLDTKIQSMGAKVFFNKLPVIRAYPTEIRALFQNLIANAIKFRKEGGTPEIKISAYKEGEYWKFAVADNGIGIAPRFHERIFVIFQQLNEERENSTGIGLAHCKKIIDIHNGSIWVDSKEGEGSTFYFTISDKL